MADEAVRRAREGVKKLVTYKSGGVRIEGNLLYETLYSDSLLQFLLKTWDRKTYGDQIKIDLSAVETINDVPPELFALVLEKLQADYDATQQARLEAGNSPAPAAEQTIDVKPGQIKTINDVPPELLRLVLEKLQSDYEATQHAQLETGN
jgi:hypothetical protein